MHDLIIVGGGPAGLTCSIYAARRGLETLVLEKALAGGQMNLTPDIGNWPGERSISGTKLAERMKQHAESAGAEFAQAEVTKLELSGEIKRVLAGERVYDARTVVIASGGDYRRLDVPGEEELVGKGVSYCATCDGPLFKDSIVAVVGGGNAAAEEALYLTSLASKIYLIHRRGQLRCEECRVDELEGAGVELLLNTAVEEFRGDTRLRSVKLRNMNSGEERELQVDGCFISVGVQPASGLAGEAGVEVDENGFIRVTRRMETNLEGVYAAGDVTGGVQQITVAVGEGCTAALSAYEYIRRPYWSI